MTEKLCLLLFETAYERIGRRLEKFASMVEFCRMTKDGEIHTDTGTVDAESFDPNLAWLSMDLMYHGKVPDFVSLVTGSDELQWVQTANAGLDNPVYGRIAATGTRLSNSDAQALPIAEYVMAHVLSFFQDIEGRRQAQRDSKWRYRPFREVSGTRWLIIGFGNIGQRIAARARPFEAQIVGVRQSGASHPAADEIVTQSDMLAQLPQADVVVLACPITPETEGMADANFFSAMKEGSVLVNIARGDLIDDEALLAGLAQDRPAHAVLDAFSTEPLPKEHAFWSHSKVALTAHTSNAGSGLLARGDDLFVDNLAKYLAGKPLLNEVDMAAAFPGVGKAK